jgi:hypothetical protein
MIRCIATWICGIYGYRPVSGRVVKHFDIVAIQEAQKRLGALREPHQALLPGPMATPVNSPPESSGA